jgi:hypothetical protein
MKSGNLNFLETSGSLQACNGADCFTFYFYTNAFILTSAQSLSNSSSCLIIQLKFECSLPTVLIFSVFLAGCSACHLGAQSRINDPIMAPACEIV